MAAAASDDLEITVPTTSVEDDPSSINHFHVLEDIAAFTNGRLTTQLAKRSFVRNVQISVLVATWAVVLSLPIIIWPWAAVMNHAWCRDLSLPDCNMHPGVCRVEWSLWRFTTECVPSKPSAFLNLWGTMLLQFVFSVYVDLGMTTKFTLQGLFGSCLAYVNVMFLNRVLGFLFAGGAYNGDKFTVSVPIQGESYQTASYAVSYWLPLCNNGEVRFADNAAHCFLNIWLDKLTWSGFLRLGVLWVDFALFVLLCFSVPFDPNPRMFALSTHVSFMMTFVNPSADGFSTEPTYATDYLYMILAASVMSLLCFFLPRLRFTATEAAGDWACDALQATRVLVKHIPSSLDGVLRLKIRTVEQCALQLLQGLERSLASAWFEGYAYAYWKCRSDYDKKRYQRLKLLVDGLRRCLDRLPAVYSTAALVDTSGAWVSEEAFQLLQQHSERTATKMAQVLRCAFSEASREEPGSSQMGLAVWKGEGPEINAFLCAASMVLVEIEDIVEEFLATTGAVSGTRASPAPEEESWYRSCGGWYSKTRLVLFKLLCHSDDTAATHPRFVVRNTISICLAFGLGWVGVWNTMPSYSAYPASTIGVIVYTYTGATPSVTLRRLSGVVLGKAAGAILQLSLAVKNVLYVIAFAMSMWLIVGLTFFQYIHSEDAVDFAVVCGLTAAYAASSMIPSNGVLRKVNERTTDTVLPTLMNTILQTLIGIGIMLVVDALLASRASNQARQRLMRAFTRLVRGVRACKEQGMSRENAETFAREHTEATAGFLQDLNALKTLLPYAAAEATYWSKPLNLALFESLEVHLRNVASHSAALVRAFQCAEQVRVSSLPAWPALYRFFHQQLLHNLIEIRDITEGLLSSHSEDNLELQEVRQRLAESLYTFQVAEKMATTFNTMVAKKEKGARAERPERVQPSSSSGLVSRVHRVYKQFLHEELEEDTDNVSFSHRPSEKHRVGDVAEELQELVSRVRVEAQSLEAAEGARLAVPAACVVDLVNHLMVCMLNEVKEMQLATLKF
ncbi:unnamed protein product [Symbiodinium sp. CCMP2456]|nr:unnamed protein product [Symbiodinium sp. CCMP2456]